MLHRGFERLSRHNLTGIDWPYLRQAPGQIPGLKQSAKVRAHGGISGVFKDFNSARVVPSCRHLGLTMFQQLFRLREHVMDIRNLMPLELEILWQTRLFILQRQRRQCAPAQNREMTFAGHYFAPRRAEKHLSHRVYSPRKSRAPKRTALFCACASSWQPCRLAQPISTSWSITMTRSVGVVCPCGPSVLCGHASKQRFGAVASSLKTGERRG